MNKIIFTLLLLCFSFSDTVDLNRATQIAQNFSNSRINSFELDEVDVIEENNKQLDETNGFRKIITMINNALFIKK